MSKKCETETQLVSTSWQHAITGNNCLHSPNSHVLPCPWNIKLRTWPSWLADRASGCQLWTTWKLQKRLSLWNSRCWSASSVTTLQSTCSSRYFLLLTMHNNRRNGGMSSSHQQAWQQNNCLKDKEKVIANFYLQHHLRALQMFLSPMEKAGRCGERSTEVSTLHHILHFLDGCWLRPRPSFEYPLIWHIQVRN